MNPDRPPKEEAPDRRAGSSPRLGKHAWWIAGVVLVIAGIAATWAFTEQRAAARALERTENTLQLQVLASRLGMAAFTAEYGDYETARRFTSQAFDGFANHAIEEGTLRQEYADVLASRDDVIAMLATRRAEVVERLMTLFFRLQIPVDPELDPSRILPAADSGLGFDPPRRAVSGRGATDSAVRVDTTNNAARGDTLGTPPDGS